jgi:hypothetical protein
VHRKCKRTATNTTTERSARQDNRRRSRAAAVLEPLASDGLAQHLGGLCGEVTPHLQDGWLPVASLVCREKDRAHRTVCTCGASRLYHRATARCGKRSCLLLPQDATAMASFPALLVFNPLPPVPETRTQTPATPPPSQRQLYPGYQAGGVYVGWEAGYGYLGVCVCVCVCVCV